MGRVAGCMSEGHTRVSLGERRDAARVNCTWVLLVSCRPIDVLPPQVQEDTRFSGHSGGAVVKETSTHILCPRGMRVNEKWLEKGSALSCTQKEVSIPLSDTKE